MVTLGSTLRATFVCILTFSIGCAELTTLGTKSRPETRTIRVRLPQPPDAKGDRSLAETQPRVFTVTVPRIVVPISPDPPLGIEFEKPWRPLRYFGPFRTGSDPWRIEILVNDSSAFWLYNDFFASVTDTDELDVYRTYYRRNLVGDPLSTAVLPTNTRPSFLPAASSSDRRQGFASDVLFSLAEIAYSDRYGGSVRLRFELADAPLPTRPEPAPENFEYEFGRDAPAAGGPAWLFDANDIGMVVYVRPKAGLINPKSNPIFAAETFVEFDLRNFVAYRDGVALAPGAGRDELISVLAVTAQRVANSLNASNPSNIRPHHSLFTHAWIHHQHFGLIGLGNKVNQLFIADGWADPLTSAYVPVIFVSFRALDLSDSQSDPGMFEYDFEGDEEWKLSLRVFREYNGTESQTGRYVWSIDDEGESTSWRTVVVTDPGQECLINTQFSLRLKLKEEDPIDDDAYDGAPNTLLLDCAVLDQVIAAGSWPRLDLGFRLIPVNELADDYPVGTCELLSTPIPPIPLGFTREYCYTDDGRLVGFDGLTVARLTWEAKVDILAR